MSSPSPVASPRVPTPNPSFGKVFSPRTSSAQAPTAAATGTSSITSSAKPNEPVKPESKKFLPREHKGCFQAIGDFLATLWQKIILCFRSKGEKAAIKQFNDDLEKMIKETGLTKETLKDVQKLTDMLKTLPEKGSISKDQETTFMGELDKLSPSLKEGVGRSIQKSGFETAVQKAKRTAPLAFHGPVILFLENCAKKKWDPKARVAVFSQLDGSDQRFLDKAFKNAYPNEKGGFKSFLKTPAAEKDDVLPKILLGLVGAQGLGDGEDEEAAGTPPQDEL